MERSGYKCFVHFSLKQFIFKGPGPPGQTYIDHVGADIVFCVHYEYVTQGKVENNIITDDTSSITIS